MQIQNALHLIKHYDNFLCGKTRIVEKGECNPYLEIKLKPRKKEKGICSCCGEEGACYDYLKERCFKFKPMYNLPVFFIYQMRRIDCKQCGIKVESVPWEKQKRIKKMMRCLLAGVKKLLCLFGIKGQPKRQLLP